MFSITTRFNNTINTQDQCLYRYIRGSHAHGINTEKSDVDYGGVFLLSNEALMSVLPGLYKDEMADSKHDDTMWELNKFARLLMTSNPTALEAMFVDEKFVKFCDPAFKVFLEYRDLFLTKECFKPFGHYAAAQIRKARGLNKMINQPILERKTPIDFCYVTYENDTKPVKEWLEINHLKEEDISLAKLNHGKDAYAVFLYPGGFCKSNGNDVHVNNLPKGLHAIATLFFNKDSYTSHCKDYKRQKEWEANRNPVRYESNLGKSYDAKNMSECVRLVHTCTEIARGDTYHVDRTGRDAGFLLGIRAHNYEYDQLMEMLNNDVDEMEKAIENSTIPDTLDQTMVNELMMDIRKKIGNF